MVKKIKRILIVDDDRAYRTLIRKMLPQYEIIEATGGEQGINLALSEKPDLILMDIMMPEVDGYTACREIKKNEATKAIPVVMLTSLDFELNEKLAKDVGADEFLTKPVDPAELLEVIRRVKTCERET